MISPSQIKVYVRYLGVFRLLLGRKEDVLEFSTTVSLTTVLQEIRKLLPESLCKQMGTQTLMLSSKAGEPGRILNLSSDSDITIADGSCITIVTPVTGG